MFADRIKLYMKSITNLFIQNKAKTIKKSSFKIYLLSFIALSIKA